MKVRQNYTKLDLIKYDNPYLGPRIQLMLQQLEFKLSVEKQYKEGIEKMLKLYQIEGDRRSKAEAESKLGESTQKIQLLSKSLKRYSDMHVDIEEDFGDHDDNESLTTSNLRRPLTGNLFIACYGIKDADHVASSRFQRAPESFITVKVEDQTRARTKLTRNERWADEFNISVDKANEVEILVYDRSGDRDVPVGMMWLRISDIAEALRRKKVEQEINNAGWVSADTVVNDNNNSVSNYSNDSHLGHRQQPGHHHGAHILGGTGAGGVGGAGAGAGAMTSNSVIENQLMIKEWFVLEPAGQIHLALGFEKTNRGPKRLYDGVGGLGRQGAIRQKKDEEVHEVHGHKFAPQQFYNIMRCALCGDFLKYSSGFQCTDCRYTCHKKCYPKVVTKCISKASTESDPDEEKLNHRIPHRFEPVTNMSANWCCHCGYILPLGKKNVRKCSECGLTCHSQCMHLVPDFCGMSMEMANQIMATIRDTKSRKKQFPQQIQQQPQLQLQPQVSSPYQQQSQQFAQLPSYPQAAPPPPKKEPIKRKEVGSSSPVIPLQSKQPASQSPPSPEAYNKPFEEPSAGEYDDVAAAATMTEPQDIQEKRMSADQYQLAPSPQLPALQFQQPPSSPKQVRKSRKKVGLDDFNFLAVLGKGNFGKVMLAESKNLKQLYAIKVLKKDFIIENDEVESTRSEKRVFLIANRERHPFLLNLHSCFQTENRVYFVMEYVSGGDLMWHIQKELFTPRRAQFYAAEVLLALKYFHDNGVIYRDLKLDNILLTLSGHIKIGDYGLCKEDMWYGKTTGTFCGTPEFMGPEILLEQKYGRAVDWWAFGVLIYQMLLGKSPFRGDDDDEVFDAILSDEPLYPIHMPRDSVSILQKLLTREPEKRLGSGPKDAEEIMVHPYFRNINFDDIYHCRVTPPFIPKIDSATDVRNFDSEFTSEVPALTPVSTTLTPLMQEQFRGFSYLNGEDV